MATRRLGAALAAALVSLLLAAGARAERPYTVRPGDTLTGLARRFGTSVPELMARNGLSGNLLRVGQVLQVPGGQAVGYRTTFVAPGETLASLARRVARAPATLRSANPSLPAGVLPAGAAVSIPPADGTTVVAAPGDSLASLAARAGASAAKLAEVNGLTPGAPLEPGTSVLLPAGAGAAPGPHPSSARPATPAPSTGSPATPAPGAAPPASAAAVERPSADPATARERLRAGADRVLLAAVLRLPTVTFARRTFEPPLHGRVSSAFGWRTLSVNGNHFHAGVDLAAPFGTAVHAARDGTVAKAGWGGSYGYVVYLDHGDGTQTRYAHLSRIDVRVGQALRQGDVLGRVGSTGASTGPHLHFELRFDGRAVDPLAYLRGSSPP